MLQALSLQISRDTDNKLNLKGFYVFAKVF